MRPLRRLAGGSVYAYARMTGGPIPSQAESFRWASATAAGDKEHTHELTGGGEVQLLRVRLRSGV